MNGDAARRAHSTRAVPATAITATSHHRGPSAKDRMKISKAIRVVVNRPTPGRSSVVGRPVGSGRARGRIRQARTSPITVSGTFTTKIAGQPAQATRNPPSTGPSAAQLELAMLIAPRAPAGVLSGGAAIRIAVSAAG